VLKGGTVLACAGNPVMAVPGETPTSPLMTEPVPAAVTVVPPTMAKLLAAPTVCAHAGDGLHKRTANPTPALAASVKYRLIHAYLFLRHAKLRDGRKLVAAHVLALHGPPAQRDDARGGQKDRQHDERPF
jgi:hypothetical protein